MIRLMLMLVLAMSMGLQAEDDVVHLQRGAPVAGKIEVITEKFVRIKVTLSKGGVSGSSVRNVPLSQVRFIDFAPLPGEEAALARPVRAGARALGALWDKKLADLGRPNSNAGAIGLALADLLVDSASEVDRDRALRLYSKIELEDWEVKRTALASRGRLRALIVLGRAEEVLAEAQAIANETEDLDLLLHAQHVINQADLERFKAGLEENPKWREDEEVRAEIAALYNRVLDQFLTPYLFNGSEVEAAARGLWFARQTYLLGEEPARALECAQDIVKLYPESSFAEKARASIESNQSSNDDDDKRQPDK